MKKSTFIKLGVVAALVLLPRRSSKKAEGASARDCSANTGADKKTIPQACDGKKSCGCPFCKCPLCRIGKCPLCAIGQCWGGKKSAPNAEK